VRFYTRTSANRGYSNGPFFELLRLSAPWLVVLLFISAIVGAFQGQAGSLFLALAMGLGAKWGAK
jgi:hypothetical protein